MVSKEYSKYLSLGSIPSGASMATIFKYNNKYFQTLNLNKKLKRLKINPSDIEILYEGDLSQNELEKKFLELTQEQKIDEVEDWHSRNLYYFTNIKTGETITSIYDNLNNLPIKQSDWIKT